jgi:hypothetical protein
MLTLQAVIRKTRDDGRSEAYSHPKRAVALRALRKHVGDAFARENSQSRYFRSS